jgi:DNA-binding MarR family transcriptional regulator
LSRLEARGCVRREPSPSDRRSQVVSITDAGARVVNEAREVDRAVPEHAAVDADRLRKELLTALWMRSAALAGRSSALRSGHGEGVLAGMMLLLEVHPRGPR